MAILTAGNGSTAFLIDWGGAAQRQAVGRLPSNAVLLAILMTGAIIIVDASHQRHYPCGLLFGVNQLFWSVHGCYRIARQSRSDHRCQ
jgi:hypothetical protein